MKSFLNLYVERNLFLGETSFTISCYPHIFMDIKNQTEIEANMSDTVCS